MKMLVKGVNGANGVKQTTYVDLLALRNASSLIPLQKYAFEFRTYHKIPDTDPAEYYTGPTETIVVEAISASELNPVVQSLDHPDDIIYYELVSTNTCDLGVSFDRGRIIRRMVSKHGIDIGADFRGMKFKRRQLFSRPSGGGAYLSIDLTPTAYFPLNYSVSGNEYDVNGTWYIDIAEGLLMSYRQGFGADIETGVELTAGVPYELKDANLNGIGLFVTFTADTPAGAYGVGVTSLGFIGFTGNTEMSFDNSCPNYLNHVVKGYDTLNVPIIPFDYDPLHYIGIKIGQTYPNYLIDTVFSHNPGDPTHLSIEIGDFCTRLSIGSGVAAIDIRPYNETAVIWGGSQKVRIDYSNGNNFVAGSQVELGCCVDGTCVYTRETGENVTVLASNGYVVNSQTVHVGKGMNYTEVNGQSDVIITAAGSNLAVTVGPTDGVLTLPDPCRAGIVFVSGNSPVTSIVGLPNWDIEIRPADVGSFLLTTPTALADVNANNILVDSINGVSWDYYKDSEAFCVVRKQTITNLNGTFTIARVIRSFGGWAD